MIMTENKKRPTAANSEAIEGLSTGSYDDSTAVVPASSSTATHRVGPRPSQHVATSEETLIDEVVSHYLTSVADKSVTMTEIRDTLISQINSTFELENLGRAAVKDENGFIIEAASTSPPIPKVRFLDEGTVVRVLLARFRIVKIDLADGLGEADMEILARYVEDGPDAGTYDTGADELKRLATELKPSLTANSMNSLYESLRVHAPKVLRTRERHLCPVANGVFDTARQELRPFSPDWVFLTKSSTEYDPNAQNPVIIMPDGESWDVETWMRDLSDDEGVPELLWEAISACVRPHEPWNKSMWLTATQGNNGKGTFVQLQRNLLGRSAFSSVQLVDFGHDFKKEGLVRTSVNLVDENDVGAFSEKLGDWKACVTGDVFTMNRKYKTPIQFRWQGFEVQCFNIEVPRVRDKSVSFLRRLLIVPFRKNFEGIERKYIKHDYLARPDVLRYVLKRALHMQHTELSNPPVCREALHEYNGTNNKVVGFWREFEDQFQWQLVPSNFLYDLYKSWLSKTDPSAKPEGSKPFVAALRSLLADSPDWTFSESVRHSTGGLDKPEMLIAHYDLKDWMPGQYSGTDSIRWSTMDPYSVAYRVNYRGFVRATPLSTLPFDDDEA